MIDSVDDTAELELLRTRGDEAVAALMHRQRQKLSRMVAMRLDRRIVGKVATEDILQDAFVEAARRVQDYLDRPSVPFFVWLRRITSQVLIDTHRRYLGARMRDVRQEVSSYRGGSAGASSVSLAAQLADSLTTPSQCAVRGEMLDELRTALDALDEIDREVLVLRHLEELSNNEVAQILGIDRFAASKRYLRALERLRNVMVVAE